ncbi:glycosyltransferase family 4 protein [Aureimonas sp. SK2]|uniref:glycosyltransferase family 4 protein n=1 Tax=Aureimonas sp. SK2 TaxID=3015992 RepID=UPI002445121A|nr:glycosyltransferase family 4 protein [Aureimonas sp. SK2]
MFVDLPPSEPHADPWHASFSYRLHQLRRKGYRIAYFYERPDNSTFRYRIFNMMEVIEANWPEASASYFHLGDAAHLKTIVQSADVIVICRARYGDVVASLLLLARQRGIPVLFDVDDLVFDTQYVHLLTKSLAQPMAAEVDWDFWFAYVGRIGATLRHCDGAIATNAYLAERISDASQVPTAIIPNFLNEKQVARSGRIVEAKRASGFARDGHVHIGYFSGSPTHAKDFEQAASALARILDRYPVARVRMVGYLDVPPQLQAYETRIDRVGFHDYVNLQGLIGSTEINIAPLQDNRFTNCKSELKYFEAAIVGTVTIASPTHTFRDAIRHGENSYLARAHEWEQAIATVLETLVEDPAAYARVAEAGISDAEEKFCWRRQTDRIKAALLDGVASFSSSGSGSGNSAPRPGGEPRADAPRPAERAV